MLWFTQAKIIANNNWRTLFIWLEITEEEETRRHFRRMSTAFPDPVLGTGPGSCMEWDWTRVQYGVDTTPLLWTDRLTDTIQLKTSPLPLRWRAVSITKKFICIWSIPKNNTVRCFFIGIRQFEDRILGFVYISKNLFHRCLHVLLRIIDCAYTQF